MEFENQETEMKINNLLVNGLVTRIDQSWEVCLCQTFFLALHILCWCNFWWQKHVNKETANFHVSYCLEGMEEISCYVLILNFKKGEEYPLLPSKSSSQLKLTGTETSWSFTLCLATLDVLQNLLFLPFLPPSLLSQCKDNMLQGVWSNRRGVQASQGFSGNNVFNKICDNGKKETEWGCVCCSIWKCIWVGGRLWSYGQNFNMYLLLNATAAQQDRRNSDTAPAGISARGFVAIQMTGKRAACFLALWAYRRT